MIKPLQPGFRPWVNRPTALRAMEIPPCPLRGTSPRESVSRNFRLPCGPLQISFACHPANGGRITRAYGRVAYEEIAFQSFIVPPLSGGEGGAVRHQRGISLARRAVGLFSDGRKPGCKGFIIRGRLLSIHRRPTITLSGVAAVKLKNPRGDSPVKL